MVYVLDGGAESSQVYNAILHTFLKFLYHIAAEKSFTDTTLQEFLVARAFKSPGAKRAGIVDLCSVKYVPDIAVILPDSALVGGAKTHSRTMLVARWGGE